MAQKLVNLKAASYEHPFDQKALATVKKLPVLPKLAESVMKWTVIRQSVIALCGSDFHITRDACPDLYKLCDETFDTLDLIVRPEVYSQQDYYINAYTTGYETDSFIVLSTGAVDRLSDCELQFVVGHEAGHIKSGHVLYHLMSAYIGVAATAIPAVGPLMTQPLVAGLRYWNRMSEFTADRAGLLACQDLNAAISAIMKMSGLPERYYKNASLEGFKQQAKEFEHRYGGTTDKMYRMLEILDEDHPWTVLRAAELIKWVESGEYDKVLRGAEGKTCPVCGMSVDNNVAVCPACGRNF